MATGLANTASSPASTEPRLTEQGPWRRHPVLWVCGAHVLLAVLLFDPKPFTGGDNFWYMILAESLRGGHGYRDIWLPGAPLHVHYPPLYPLVLAAIGWVGDSVLAYKALSLACTTAAVALTYALARRRTDDAALALAAALLVAVTPLVVEYGHWELSDAPFLLLVTLSLYGLVRDAEDQQGRWFALGCAAALAAYLTRSAGGPLLLAIVVATALRRQWQRLGWFAGAAALVVVAWSTYVQAAAPGASYTTYGQELFYRDPYRPELGHLTLSTLWERIAANLQIYALSAWPQAVAGRDLDRGLAGAMGLALASTVLVGALGRVRRLAAPEIFFLTYAAVLLVWPAAWADQRLLLPLVPLAGVYLAEGTSRLMGSGGGRRPALARAALGVCIGLALAANLRIVVPAVRCSQRVLSGEPDACAPGAFASFVRAARWLKHRAEPGAVVISRKPQILYWYARRVGVMYPFTQDADSLIRFLDAQHTRYVVVDQLHESTGRYLLPTIQRHSSRFSMIHTDGAPATYVLEYAGADR